MTQAQSYEAWRITYQSDEQAARSAFDTAEMLRQELLVARTAITSLERDVSQALTERDDATDFIDKILDEVLGQDRHEWTSAYDWDDALADVEAKMAALKSGKCLHQIAEPAPTESVLIDGTAYVVHAEVAAELLRLHIELQTAPQEVQPAVPQIKANCYSNDDGDYWRDCPDDCDFVDGLKVGDTYELQASIRSWSETFRVTKAPDETSDDYEVELVSSNATAHPAEGVLAPMPVAHPHHCTARTADGSCEECEGHAQAMAEWNTERAALAATHPAAQGMEQAIEWPKARDVGRFGDMSPDAFIRVGLDADNDVYVSICDGNSVSDIEFCTPGGGGGRSSRTRMALIALMCAIEADNASHPSFDFWQRSIAAQAKQGGA